ncbi:MAG: RiPP maturation radical SAM C-methyltransferase [Dissulfurimicrobium sp.]|uniref:RiPP maturation radical SAM C-methyltransferase n=1 Tax=Dissulfurimicrobium sp. TaxID=2022436 RepID=UPI00404AB4AD
MKIVLVSPPWPLFNRPSIQIAALKSYLRQEQPYVDISCHHPYLDLAARIGFDTYQIISESNWASEAICAGIIFPEMKDDCNRLFLKTIERRTVQGKKKPSQPFEPEMVRSVANEVLTSFVSSLDLDAINLVGLTVSINQLTAAFVIARAVKSFAPSIPIVLGGAAVSGMAGLSILRSFPEIDYVIDGEGERPLSGLIDFLLGKKDSLPKAVYGKMDLPGNKCVRLGHQQKALSDGWQKNQIDCIDTLPMPDFDDYFRDLLRLGPNKRFFPVLPVEFSRGCWWARCNFCNLNLQWSGYRSKSAEKVASEIDMLARRYGLLDFAFMDNSLPRHDAVEFFDLLKGHGRDYRFFAEVRADYSRDELNAMAMGGLKVIQVGIEALSQSLLRRMRKGVSVMDNIAVMRHAEEYGLELSANLILHFPGSTDDEVEETLSVLEFVWPFRPLKVVSFWLGFGSPVAAAPDRFGIKSVGPHPFWRLLFPKGVLAGITPLVFGYKGDILVQKRRWKRVEQRIAEWQRKRAKLGPQKLLTYRDGGDYLIIRQVLPSGEVLMHRLKGPSRAIYLACLEPMLLQTIFTRFPDRPQKEITAFLKGLVAKRLMFEHQGKFLGLAVRCHNSFIGSVSQG